MYLDPMYRYLGLYLDHSRNYRVVEPLLSWLVVTWLCAYNHCHVGGWTFAPVRGSVEQVFIEKCILLHSGILQPWLVYLSLLLSKTPHNMILPPPGFTVGIVLCRWWAMSGFFQTVQSRFHQTREPCSSQSESLLAASLQAASELSCMLQSLGHKGQISEKLQ